MTDRGQYGEALSDLNNARRYGIETFDLQIATARVHYHLGNYTDALTDNLLPAVQQSSELSTLRIKEVRLAEAYALRALIFETNPDNINDAIRHWGWILDLEHVLPETLALARQHYNELTGAGPTRTPTSSPTASPTPGISPTPVTTGTPSTPTPSS
jgi:hypothetical protein